MTCRVESVQLGQAGSAVSVNLSPFYVVTPFEARGWSITDHHARLDKLTTATARMAR
jgi:hypothetical protein